MNNKLRQKDWEFLSAYLDGELSDEEEHDVRIRLASDNAFDELYKKIQYTHKLLTALPHVDPPRHFTISREMLQSKWSKLFSKSLSWNIATAVAGVMLVVVVLGDVLSFGAALEQSFPESAFVLEAADSDFAEVAAAPEALEENRADDGAAQVTSEEAQKEAELEAAPLAIDETDGIEIAGDVQEIIDSSPGNIFRFAEAVLLAMVIISAWLARRKKPKPN